MPVISKIFGREILDSRGVPTLEVEVILDEVVSARAAVPAGASTGSHEAQELRDRDPQRFFGKGLLKAMDKIEELSAHLKGYVITDLKTMDQTLKDLDGTENKSHLGANTILGISLACAKAMSSHYGKEFFEYMGSDNCILPVPLINVLNGGVHANNGLVIQEFMIVPYGFHSFKEALRAASEVFYHLKESLKEQKLSISVGDEGGFAPFISSSERVIQLLLKAIKKSGYSTDNQMALALDVAASERYRNGKYMWEDDEEIRAEDLIAIYRNWVAGYPIVSIEDGLAEDDWPGWQKLTKELGGKTQLLGDDVFVTHIERLKKGINMNVANALLAKVNQVGTLSETYEAIQLAHSASYTCCLSHRSGETEDTSIADLSVAWGVEQIKTGSVCRGERTAKYNRLLRIEEALEHKADFAGKRAFSHME